MATLRDRGLVLQIAPVALAEPSLVAERILIIVDQELLLKTLFRPANRVEQPTLAALNNREEAVRSD